LSPARIRGLSSRSRFPDCGADRKDAAFLCLAGVAVRSAGSSVRLRGREPVTHYAPSLKQVLEVRDSQSGFAGISGTVWRIEPDGRYVGARFANQIEGPPVLSGKLDPQTLARLAELLRSDA
jgi:hypothetical protein